MKMIAIYPGSFCPPTYGHLCIIKKAVKVFGGLQIVCSVNPDKDEKWFTPEECKTMWQTFELPANVKVLTLDEFMKTGVKPSQIVMVRGIRNDDDFDYEKKVLNLNKAQFGIDKYFYFLSDPEFCEVSSSRVRAMAYEIDLENLIDYVTPYILTCVLEKSQGYKNLFLAVGKPASGKTTFLQKLCQQNPDCVHINMDIWNDRLKEIIAKRFPGRDLINLALEDEARLNEVVGQEWKALLKMELKFARGKKHVFVEAAYGLMPGKHVYTVAGGKVIFFDCRGDEESNRRIIARGTPEHAGFVKAIPGWEESLKIAKAKGLELIGIDTNGPIETFDEKVGKFKQFLESYEYGRGYHGRNVC